MLCRHTPKVGAVVNDIAPIPFQKYLGMTTDPVENGLLESGIVTTSKSDRCQKRIYPSPRMVAHPGGCAREHQRPRRPAPRGLFVPMSVSGTNGRSMCADECLFLVEKR